MSLSNRVSQVHRLRAAVAAAASLLLSAPVLAADPPAARKSVQPIEADPAKAFVAHVLGSTEAVWHSVFGKMGKRYTEPTLVLFSMATRGACGSQLSLSGPQYCEGDSRIYVDLEFFRVLQDRYRAKGDMARAYIIAHEVGHHVQNLLGILGRVGKLEQTLDQRGRNALSVKVELQADCLAGVWAGIADKLSPGMIEPGDIEAGMGAAAAVGADTMQKAAGGVVVPESFTHGTSEQRMRWFKTGFDAAQVQACDTFTAKQL